MHRVPVIAYVGPKFREVNTKLVCEQLASDFERDIPCRIHFYPNMQTLLADLAGDKPPLDFVCLDLEYLQTVNSSTMFDVISTLAVFLKVTNSEAEIVGMVGDNTDPVLIRQSRQIPEIRALCTRVGGTWTYGSVLEVAHNIYVNRNWALPDAIKNLIKSPAKKSKHPPTSIVLTPRQTQILDLISTRGASNKVIARTLKISESTVKLHMSAILKKYGCRNRTQLAVFSRDRKRDYTPA